MLGRHAHILGDHPGRTRRSQDHEDRRRQDGETGIQGRIAKHILQELLADKHRPHQRTKDDDAGQSRHPEGGATGNVKVIQRVPGPPLPDDEQDSSVGAKAASKAAGMANVTPRMSISLRP